MLVVFLLTLVELVLDCRTRRSSSQASLFGSLTSLNEAVEQKHKGQQVHEHRRIAKEENRQSHVRNLEHDAPRMLVIASPKVLIRRVVQTKLSIIARVVITFGHDPNLSSHHNAATRTLLKGKQNKN